MSLRTLIFQYLGLFITGLSVGSARTKQNLVCFAKKSVKCERFLSPTKIFLKCHQTSKMPWRRFEGLQCFVRQQYHLFLDSYIFPSLGLLTVPHEHGQCIKVPLIGISGFIWKKFSDVSMSKLAFSFFLSLFLIEGVLKRAVFLIKSD